MDTTSRPVPRPETLFMVALQTDASESEEIQEGNTLIRRDRHSYWCCSGHAEFLGRIPGIFVTSAKRC
jgi:hypothetical protein